MTPSRRSGWVGALLLAGAIALAGCETLGLGRGVETSGFLRDYAQLKKGGEGQARLIYIDTAADFSDYEAIWIDPVGIWDPEISAPAMAPSHALRERAGHFDAALRRELGGDFELVERPGPGTLHLRVALTESKRPGLSVEVELLDAASGRRLVAAVDHREPPEDDDEDEDERNDDARDGDGAVEAWAEVIRARLVAFRDFDRAQRRTDSEASD